MDKLLGMKVKSTRKSCIGFAGLVGEVIEAPTQIPNSVIVAWNSKKKAEKFGWVNERDAKQRFCTFEPISSLIVLGEKED